MNANDDMNQNKTFSANNLGSWSTYAEIQNHLIG